MPTPARALPLTRRQGLRAVVALAPLGLVAACTGGSEGATAASTAAGSAGPAPQDASASATAESALIAQYEAAIALGGRPDVITLLTSIRDQHAQHRDALGGAADAPAPAAPASLAAAVSALIDAERRASRERVHACVAADTPELARTLTFIAASEASHVPALKDVRA